jgi:hypothetical protein
MCATARPQLAKADTAFRGASVGQPTEPCLAERVQSIEFSGTYNDDGAEVEATAVVGKHRIRYDATLRLLAAG